MLGNDAALAGEAASARVRRAAINGRTYPVIGRHAGNALTAMPVYLPADPAIPVEGIPAEPRFERAFGNEQRLLQRERKSAAGWLWGTAYGLVLALALGFLAALAWGVHRVASPPPGPNPPRFERTRAPEPAIR